MFLIYTYLFNLYIRPQDWMSILYGWPVDYLVMIPALIYGYAALKSQKNGLVKIPQYNLLFAMLAIIFLSDAVNGYVDLGITQFTLYFKRVCIFLIVILLVPAPPLSSLIMKYLGLEVLHLTELLSEGDTLTKLFPESENGQIGAMRGDIWQSHTKA